MNILITGAGGQLGRALPPCLDGHDVVTLDRAALDIADLDAVRAALAAHRPDVVVNAAAYNQVDRAESEPDAAYVGNALGPRNLALATAALDIVLVHGSTDYVFDGLATRPYHEYDRPNPRCVYGASKLAGEEAVRALNPRHYVVRTAWLFHPGGQNFARTIAGLAERGPVRVVSDQYGSPTYVPHLAAGIAQLIESDAYGTYHLAGRGGASWYEFTTVLFQALELTAPVQPVATAAFPRPARRPPYAVLTTLQTPRIELPAWEEGVTAYARAVRG